MNEKPDIARVFDRWSRQKLARRGKDHDALAASEKNLSPAAARSIESNFVDFNYAALDFASDYRKFMASAVPDSVRIQALRRLWQSSALISQPDQLDDYLEDFSEQAMGLPSELVSSAYRIGCGFASLEELEPAGDKAPRVAAAHAEPGASGEEPQPERDREKSPPHDEAEIALVCPVRDIRALPQKSK